MGSPADLRYTRDHEWVRVGTDGVATIGITAYAQEQLGDIVFVELPKVGQPVAQHGTFGVVESTKSVSDLMSPLTGSVSAANEALVDTPQTVNEDPYGAGWIIQVAPSNAAELDVLMGPAEYDRYLGELDH